MTTLVAEFQRQKERAMSRSLLKVFSDIIKHDPLAVQLYNGEFQINLRTYRPMECLKRFLESYTEKVSASNRPVQLDLPEIPKHRSAVAKASPILEEKEPGDRSPQPQQSHVELPKPLPVSTRSPPPFTREAVSMGDAITPHNVSDIMKKVCKAASDGLSRSAQNSSVSGGSPLTEHPHLQHIDGCLTPDIVRPHSLWYFNKTAIESIPIAATNQNCAALPIEQQEQLLIDDLLYCFIGIAGTYIKPIITPEAEVGYSSITFQISEQIDISLRDIVKDILPVASYYSTIQKFAQRGCRQNNQVMQALSASLQAILNEYYASVVQLETEQSNNNLNLHKLLYFIRPNMQALEVLARVVSRIGQADMVGGKILTQLYDEKTHLMGDVNAQQMIIDLTERAAVPYIEMLELWILKGVIIDQHNQFFVVDHGDEFNTGPMQGKQDTARYWESRYTIHKERIPRFLDDDADIILRTGKYLNVIRQCGRTISPPAELSKLKYVATSQQHSTFIKKAYLHASKTLLQLLVKENNLMGHIFSVKRYLLLQQGDLITQFMDASEEELSKNVDKVAPVRLDNLLQLIVRLSSAKHDPCLEDLHCDLFTMDLATQMSKIHIAGNINDNSNLNLGGDDNAENIDLSGLECFVFQYNVQWPVSIILNQWALSQYQMLFRLLFYCKHVERQLCKVWIENTHTRKLSPESTDQWRCAFALRQRMLNAIQHLENYMMIEVIEPNWHIFTEKMKTVQNVDDVMIIHQDFLHICLQNCMLDNPDLLRAVMSICKACLKFCKFIQVNAKAKLPDNWASIIDSFAKEFNGFLIDLLHRVSDVSSESTTAKLVNLVCRINFNSYYNEELEQVSTKDSARADTNNRDSSDQITFITY